MTKTIVVAGYGPGISSSVAERFGRAGFSLALVARNASKLNDAVERFKAKGIPAAAVPADLTDVNAARDAVRRARAALGPIVVIHWNASTPSAGDLLTASTEELVKVFASTTLSLVAAIQEALPDLRAQKDSAVLVTNGSFGLFAEGADAAAVQTQSMGLAIANSARHKASRLLALRLKAEGIFAGEVMVKGTVKGTAWDHGNATLEPSAVADRFWELYEKRATHLADVG